VSAPALEVSGLTVRYEGLTAMSSVSMTVPMGGRHGVVGPNGAGKTTLFNAITGFSPVAAGSVVMAGTDVTNHHPAARARMGLARTFQITHLMPTLSTFENVMLGSLVMTGESKFWWRDRTSAEKSMVNTWSVLEMLNLTSVAEVRIAELSYGDQRRIEIAVAMATQPAVLLLDEPAAGLSAAERQSIVDLLLNMPDTLTTVVIEHDLEVVFALADTVTVLNGGLEVMTGTGEEIRNDPHVKEIYLGSD
jgi:branched-chain amino acid transport system ATP-binding protein